MLKKYSSRRLARLASIQATYQKLQTDDKIDDVVSHFENYHFVDGVLQSRVEPDMNLFKNITYGVENHHEELKNIVSTHLNDQWRVDRLSCICFCLLLCAVYELLYEKTPQSVSINEYIELSKDFLNDKEIKFINGILDKILKNNPI